MASRSAALVYCGDDFSFQSSRVNKDKRHRDEKIKLTEHTCASLAGGVASGLLVASGLAVVAFTAAAGTADDALVVGLSSLPGTSADLFRDLEGVRERERECEREREEPEEGLRRLRWPDGPPRLPPPPLPPPPLRPLPRPFRRPLLSSSDNGLLLLLLLRLRLRLRLLL